MKMLPNELGTIWINYLTGWHICLLNASCWLGLGMFHHPAWAVGSYNSGIPAVRAVGTKSTGGFYQEDVSPCTSNWWQKLMNWPLTVIFAWITCFFPWWSINLQVSSSTEAETICSREWDAGNVRSSSLISDLSTARHAIPRLPVPELALEDQEAKLSIYVTSASCRGRWGSKYYNFLKKSI